MPRTRLPSRPAVIPSAPEATRTHKGRAVLDDYEAMAAEIEHLRNQLAAQQQEDQDTLTIRINQAGGMYIHNGKTGFNIFVGHWEIVMRHFKEIDAWVRDHKGELTRKRQQYTTNRYQNTR